MSQREQERILELDAALALLREEKEKIAHELEVSKAVAILAALPDPALKMWRDWAKFVYVMNGSANEINDDAELRRLVCAKHDQETSALSAQLATLQAALKAMDEEWNERSRLCPLCKDKDFPCGCCCERACRIVDLRDVLAALLPSSDTETR